MNWDAIGAISELLGSIAVFVTLGYLAIQIRQARSETRRALSQGRMEANRALLELHLDERHLAARLKAEAALGDAPLPIIGTLVERAGLTQEEAWRVFLVEVARWNYRIHVITHWNELSPSEQAIFDTAVRHRMSSDLAQLFWDQHFKRQAHADVVRYLERVLDG